MNVEEKGATPSWVGWNGDGVSFEDLVRAMGSAMGVSPVAAMQNTVVMLCVDILSQDISKAPLRMRKLTPRGSSIVVRGSDHRVAEFLALDPNDRHTWKEFWEMIVIWLGIKSNSYIYAPQNKRGEIKTLVPLQAWHVTERANRKSREIFYQVVASTEHERALLGFQNKVVPEREIIHFRTRMMDGFSGLPTIELGAATINLSNALEKFRNEIVSEAGQLRGVFRRKTPGAMNETAFQRFREQMNELLRSYMRSRKPIVLEDDVEFQQTSSNPEQMELTKLFEKQIEQTCRLFRIPPHKAMHLINVKYENMEVLEKAYVGDTLDPILKTIEQRMTRSMLSREDRMAGYFLEFDRSELTLRDPKVMMEQTDKFVKSGLLTRGEARVEHGWEEVTGRDDVFMYPANTMLIGQDNKPILQPQSLPEPRKQ